MAKGFKCEHPIRKLGSPFPPQRCGKCIACQRHKTWRIKHRALWEMEVAPKTIFLTLTWRSRGKGWKPTWEECYSDFQKFFKRVRDHEHRKNPDDPRLRYLCAAELGERNGRFHLHILVHGGNHLSVTALRKQWKQGHTHGRIAGPDQASYVAKYATKSSGGAGRVRASNGYGSQAARAWSVEASEKVVENETYQKVMELFPQAVVVNIRPKFIGRNARGPIELQRAAREGREDNYKLSTVPGKSAAAAAKARRENSCLVATQRRHTGRV